MIYKTLDLTGLQANELRRLTVGDLLFKEVPSIKLKHDNEKNRAGSEIALRLELAADLRKWTEGRDRSDRVFTVPDGIPMQKPRKTQGFTGFLGMGDTEFESVTSTMSTSWHPAKATQKPGPNSPTPNGCTTGCT